MRLGPRQIPNSRLRQGCGGQAKLQKLLKGDLAERDLSFSGGVIPRKMPQLGLRRGATLDVRRDVFKMCESSRCDGFRESFNRAS